MKLLRLTASLALLCALSMAGGPVSAADGDDPLTPLYGKWRPNPELSYAKAMAGDDISEDNPEMVTDYVNKMSAIMSLSLSDSLINYSRGSHSVDMKYEVVSVNGEEITIKVFTGKNDPFWALWLDDEGFLHLESSYSKVHDFWVYEPVAIEADSAETGSP